MKKRMWGWLKKKKKTLEWWCVYICQGWRYYICIYVICLCLCIFTRNKQNFVICPIEWMTLYVNFDPLNKKILQ